MKSWKNFFKLLTGTVFLLSFIFTLVMVSYDQGDAIPAFARKYRTSCTTCHIAVPKRNAFGEAFRRNGFSMPEGDQMLIKQEPVSLGAEAWKEAFPDAVWPGLLPAEFPISAYVHQRFVAEFGDSKKNNQVEFDMPHELEIFMGGTFDESFSFFGEFVLFEKGKNNQVGGPGLKRFYFQLNDLLGPENAFNIRLGRIEPGITEGLVDNQRVMLEHATTLDYKATGKWRPRDQQSGIEFNGIVNHRFQYAAGVVNGEKATISDATDEKDAYGRVAFKIGGLGLDGYQPQELTELKQSDNWADNAVTVGAYSYFGNYETDTVGIDDDFTRFGFDLHINYDRFDMYSGAIVGKDKNPDGLPAASTDDEKELNSLAWFVEGYYTIYPWLMPGLRVGSVASDQNEDDHDKYMTFSPNLTMMARANVRVTLEALLKITGDKTVGGVTVEPTGADEEKLKWIKANIMFVF